MATWRGQRRGAYSFAGWECLREAANARPSGSVIGLTQNKTPPLNKAGVVVATRALGHTILPSFGGLPGHITAEEGFDAR